MTNADLHRAATERWISRLVWTYLGAGSVMLLMSIVILYVVNEDSLDNVSVLIGMLTIGAACFMFAAAMSFPIRTELQVGSTSCEKAAAKAATRAKLCLFVSPVALLWIAWNNATTDGWTIAVNVISAVVVLAQGVYASHVVLRKLQTIAHTAP